MDYAELCRGLEARLDKLLSPERAAHSRRVAELVAALCPREGIDADKGRAAGLAHDLCKDMPKADQRALAALYPEAEPGSALMGDKIVHGPAAAAMLARDYLVTEVEMLEAVAIHTLGKPGMRGLAAILYCADKLEPGRERLDEGYRSRCLSLPPTEMLLAVVEGLIAWMRAKGKAIAPETMILYSTLAGKAGPE